MDVERRRQPRRDALKTGTLFFAEGRQCADCLIWNLNMFGALIEVEPGAEINVTGRLSSDLLCVDRAYSMIWRDERKIGIEFSD